MRSITVGQAALFAAIATLLLTAFTAAGSASAYDIGILLSSLIPGLAWAGFFVAVYRERPVPIRVAALSAVVFGILFESALNYVLAERGTPLWTPFGSVLNAPGWLWRLAWAVFLAMFALAPDDRRTRQLALVLAIVSAPSLMNAAFGVFNSSIGFLVSDIPAQAFLRAWIAPAIRTFYWASQVLFLWTVWRNFAAQPRAVAVR
jgi:hypothetical protein